MSSMRTAVFLAVTILAAVALATSVFEDNQLCLFVALHRSRHFCGSDRWLADLDGGAISDEQHREGDLVTARGGDLLDANVVAFLNPILLSPASITAYML